MASDPKKTKRLETPRVLIRLCDSFFYTSEKMIAPMVPAKKSVRVFYKLHPVTMYKIICDTGERFGLEMTELKWCPLKEDSRELVGNLFIHYRALDPWNEVLLAQYVEKLQSELQEFNITNVSIHEVKDQTTLSQPVISEIEYNVYKLKLNYENFQVQQTKLSTLEILPVEFQNIQMLLADLEESRTRIAIFSHNAVGKSFFLNLLLLLTSESHEDYGKQEKRKILLPEEIEGNPTVKVVKDEQFGDLPEAVRDLLSSVEDDEQDFKNLVQPLCNPLIFSNKENVQSEEQFSKLSDYFTDRKRIEIEPYLMPEKEFDESFLTTTKCVIKVKYGTTFQMKIEYFDEEQLQNQLFELVSLYQASEETESTYIFQEMKERAVTSLKAKLSILTEYDEERFKNQLESFKSPEDIKLYEDIKTFAGKTELHIGKGINATEDRLALRAILKDHTRQQPDNPMILRKQIAAVKSIVVYVPSKLLYGGKEILDMPGTDDSDPLAMSFIQDALDTVDVVLLISEYAFTIAGQEVKDTLKTSRFIKNWMQNSEKYKLMLLSYTEKTWQLGKNDLKKLQKLFEQENSKRQKEMSELSKLIHPDSLSQSMKDNTITSRVLPVLYTSIHAMQIEEKISALQNKQKNEVTEDQESKNGTSSQSTSFAQESSFLKKNEDLFSGVKKKLEHIITETVEKKMESIFVKFAQHAMKRWTQIGNRVNNPGIFNPQFYGKNPLFKDKLYILFDDLDKEMSPVFETLIRELQAALAEYKSQAIALFTSELDGKRVNSHTVGNSLEHALTWHFGKTRSSMNEHTCKLTFEKHLKDSLKRHLLEPAYKDGIEHTKRKMGRHIKNVLSAVRTSFLKDIISLCNERWPSNLARFMVRACNPLISNPKSQPQGCTFCGDIKCSVCFYIESSSTFKSSNKGTIYIIQDRLNCASKNVIYLITCKKCSAQYVGQTTQSIRRRFVYHLSTIKCKKDLALPKHYNTADHSLQDISLMVIEQVTNESSILQREQYWISELNTLKPSGLNCIN
uniref:GIY-YIG domain-containing protein n=1 Tax=Leptobrachium leishanense TaxID=445787 RepID=A0A8C5LIN0_9ANUR